MPILQQRSRQRIRRRLKLDNQKAILGDADGFIKEPGESGLVRVRYVTAAGYSLPETMRLRAVLPMFPGLPILVGYDDDLKKAVVNIDWEGCVSAGIDPFVANPADREVYGFKNQESIITLLSRPTTPPSLSVVVLPFIYRDSSNTWHWFNPSAAVDLTSSVPSSGNHRVAGLFLKTDDTIEVKLSTAQNEVDPLGLSDVQECQAGATAGSIPVWFWRLVGGMTEIASEHNFLDGRQLINVGGNAGTVTSVALTMPSKFSVAGSPVTSSGTLAVTLDADAFPIEANAVPNASFETWENGTAAAPDNWTLTGASATVAREGTIIKHGLYSAKVTRAGTDCHLSSNAYTRAGSTFCRSRVYTFKAWVYATVASRVRLRVNDGVTTSNSSYHSGGSAWEELSVTFTVGAAITALNVGLAVDTGDTSGYMDGAVLIEGSRAAQAFQPEIGLFNQFPHRGEASMITLNTATSTFTPLITMQSSQVMNYVINQNGVADADDGDEFTLSFWLSEGTHFLGAIGLEANNRGKLDYYLDEEVVISGQDWYAAAAVFNSFKGSDVTVKGNGYHRLKVKVNGKNAASSDFVIGLTTVYFRPSDD